MSGKISGRVTDSGGLKGVVARAIVLLYSGSSAKQQQGPIRATRADDRGYYEFCDLKSGIYTVRTFVFGLGGSSTPASTQVTDGPATADIKVALNVSINPPSDSTGSIHRAIAGQRLAISGGWSYGENPLPNSFFNALPDGIVVPTGGSNEVEITFSRPGPKTIELRVRDTAEADVPDDCLIEGIIEAESRGGPHDDFNGPYVLATMSTYAAEPDRQMIGGNIGVRLERTSVYPTRDQALWVAIRNRTHAIGFNRYSQFINRVLQNEDIELFGNPALSARVREQRAHLFGVGAYEVLKLATEAFLLMEAGIRIEGDDLYHTESELARMGGPTSLELAKEKLREYLGPKHQLDYITRVIEAAFPEWQEGTVCRDRVLTGGINEPCLIELIWSYWQEEGMLAQSMNAITRRFQNVRAGGDRDPLAHLEIDPLRPMNNIIWGFIQDEPNRLSVKRRAYEYEHQYGLTLYGKAVGHIRPADSRSKFLEAFHNLLHMCMVFFKEDNDTTVVAEGYPLLNALKEVHLILAQGLHNSAGSMPWTARAEMMLQQYVLSRQELRDFLQSRAMVPYKEAWMPQVDTMKTLQGWTDVTVTHFRDLAVYGEQILLSVRYGDWIAINDEDAAKNWARYFKPEFYGYVNAYRAATGVDLAGSETINSTVPAVLLQKRLVMQQQRTR